MVGHRRAPGVEDGGEADARAEMLGVGGDRGQCFGRSLEQEVVDGGFVLEHDRADRADRSREGEDEVIVVNRQKLGFAISSSHCRAGREGARSFDDARQITSFWPA